jgi:hypothetical protein
VANRTVRVRIEALTADFDRGMDRSSTRAAALAANLEAADSRLANLVQTGLALAPALVPLGGAAVTAVAGLSTQFAFAAAGAGVAVLAFQGVGDALTALNDYGLEPTVANAEKVQEAMAQLSPAGREFASFINDLRPAFDDLQSAAAEGLLPGVQSGLTSLMDLAPQVQRIISTIAETTGDLAAESGENLSSERWAPFFDFLENEARPILTQFGRTTGNIVEGFANLWMSFQPLSRDFSAGMLDFSRGFSEWSRGLDQNASFQEFLSYLRETGPQVAETLGAIARAIIELVEAAAPVGQVILPVLEGLANALGSVVDSPMGPALIGVAAGIGAIGRSLAILRAVGLRGDAGGIGGMLFGGATGSIRAGTAALLAVPTAADRATRSLKEYADAEQKRHATIRAGLQSAAGVGAQVAGLAVVASGAAESMGLANTASLALMGSFAGPWGAALGGAVGITMDVASANDDLAAAIERADAAADSFDMANAGASLREAARQLEEFRSKAEPGIGGSDSWMDGLVRGWNAIEGVFGSSNVEEAEAGMDEVRESYAQMVHTMREAPARNDMRLRGLSETRDELVAATESAEDFAAALADVSAMLEGRADMRDYQAALDDFVARMDEAKNKGSFNINFEGGRENQAALDGIASAALAVADGLEGVSRVRFLEGAARQIADLGDKFKVPREQTRGLIRDLLQAAGIKVEPWIRARGVEKARSDIRALGREYGLTPKEVRTLINQPNMGAAKGQLDQLKRKYDLQPEVVDTLVKLLGVPGVLGAIGNVAGNLNALDGKTAHTWVVNTIRTVHETLRRTFGRAVPNADGNVLDFYGAGGLRERHVAQIAPAGAWRVWAEPETGGEAYIPLALSKRDRSLDIWRETGRRLGAEFVELASGALLDERYPVAPGRGTTRLVVEGRVTGTMRTPYGVVPIEGTLTRQDVRDEIDADRDFARWGAP